MADSIPNSTKPLVVMIHGLHQRAFIMRPLASKLKKAGYRTHQHDYYSLVDPVEMHSKSLNNWLKANHDPSEPLHLVGHSLGGLVMRDFIHRYPKWQIAPSVTLGTPHLGSVCADYVSRLASPLVGRAYCKGLDGDIEPLPDDVCLGVIAGNSPYGLGQLVLEHYKRQKKLPSEQGQHDGTVFVSETRLPNARDHIVLPVSHTGMLINDAVAKQTVYFLEHERFLRT